jgi:hypothetical protein
MRSAACLIRPGHAHREEATAVACSQSADMIDLCPHATLVFRAGRITCDDLRHGRDPQRAIAICVSPHRVLVEATMSR